MKKIINHSKRTIFRLMLPVTLSAMLFTGCGSSEDTTSEVAVSGTETTKEALPSESLADPGMEGKTDAYGNFASIFIPDGMKIVGGVLNGSVDPDSFQICLSENEAHFISVQITDEDICKKSIDQSRTTNSSSAKEVSFATGKNTWTGVTYRYEDMMDCFQAYGKMGEKYVLVSAAWYGYDHPKAVAVLQSLVLK